MIVFIIKLKWDLQKAEKNVNRMWTDGYVQCVVQVKMKAEVIEARRKRLFDP